MKPVTLEFSLPVEIPADKIGLPTRGATVHSCTLKRKGDEETGSFWTKTKNTARTDYIKVEGVIHPVDPAAPDIRLEASLPLDWNGKLIQQGGGGLNGYVPPSSMPFAGQDLADVSPLERGYVVFGSDGGHAITSGNFWSCKWALNLEAFENFAHASLKKARDVAVYLAELVYGVSPQKVYFFGGSNGGRECMKVIQSYPRDYDGAICFYPVIYWVLKVLADTRNADVLEKIGSAGLIDKDTHKKFLDTILELFDELDGAKDGIISNLSAAAERRKDVESALAAFLSPEQLTVLKSMAEPMSLPFPLAFGEVSLPGYNVFEGTKVDIQQSSKAEARDAGSVSGGDSIISCIFAQDPGFDPRNFNPESFKDRIQEVSRWLDAYDTNLDDFVNHGGKLILVQGTTDPLVTVHGTTQYYNNLLEKYGKEAADKFIKYFVVPGYGHGPGAAFTVSADFIGALDKWVESGVAPENMIATDINPDTKGRTRPLYEYPAYPGYDGKGDVNSADSFSPKK